MAGTGTCGRGPSLEPRAAVRGGIMNWIPSPGNSSAPDTVRHRSLVNNPERSKSREWQPNRGPVWGRSQAHLLLSKNHEGFDGSAEIYIVSGRIPCLCRRVWSGLRMSYESHGIVMVAEMADQSISEQSAI